MKSKSFTEITLEEATNAKERWLSTHKVAVKSESPPVTVRKPAGRFAPIEHGEIMSVSIAIEYEESN